jgi:RNA ligase (TIGR02306 family)
MSNIDRKLATVRKVECLKPIEGADKIELAIIDGWQVVVKKGEFQPGNLAIYFEIDSWIPTELAPFLTRAGHYPKVFEGVSGERLKTIKLRGQLSQGLLLPLLVAEDHFGNPLRQFNEREDLTEGLGIRKWEKPIPAQLAGQVKGNFPSFIPRTDQERIQNCFRDMSKVLGLFEITEKLDGSSMTVYAKYPEGGSIAETGVCSRNLDLKADDQNAFWRQAFKDDLINKLVTTGRSLALQGELIGEGIQGNPYRLKGTEFYLYDIYDIDNQVYLKSDERIRIAREIDIKHAPVLGCMSMARREELGQIRPAWTLESLLEYAESKSCLNPEVECEGIVFKHTEVDVSFKVISNKWLLKEKE